MVQNQTGILLLVHRLGSGCGSIWHFVKHLLLPYPSGHLSCFAEVYLLLPCFLLQIHRLVWLGNCFRLLPHLSDRLRLARLERRPLQALPVLFLGSGRLWLRGLLLDLHHPSGPSHREPVHILQLHSVHPHGRSAE